MKSFPWKAVRRRGAALIVVLSTILLLTAIIVSVTIAMRMERQAARYYSERTKADLFAAEAVESVKAVIQSATASSNGWVSMPGRIISWPTNAPDTITTNDLFSGLAPDTNAPDLNRFVLSEDEKTAITGAGDTNTAMRVAWVYVFKDGTRSLDLSHTNASPVIGRFAYWADDESARIDLNTAWQHQSNASISHPGQVELAALPGMTAASATVLHEAATTRPFNSPGEARRLDGLDDILSSTRFLTTHFTHSSQLNPWGEPKIYLTTQLSNLPVEIQALTNRSDYFLDILNTDNTDPGTSTILNSTKLSYQLIRLRDLLSRTNWPCLEGKSFAQKFKSGLNTNRITQLALDIVDYVRSAETTNTSVGPARVTWAFTNTLTTSNPSDANALIGVSRRPLLTEIGCAITDTTNSTNGFEIKLLAELYLPPGFNAGPVSLAGTQVNVKMSAVGTNTINLSQTNYVMTPSASSLTSGNYAVLMAKFSTTNIVSRPTTLKTRMAILLSGMNAYIEVCPLDASATISLPVNALGTYSNISATNTAGVVSAEVDDPRINKNSADWVVSASGNTFGTQNSIFGNGMTTNVSPPPDGASALASLRMPPPKGTGNSHGVSSVAELGYITTGNEVTASGVPWRTVRLQPRTSATKDTLPDWALLDLFVAPVHPTNNAALYFPGTNVVAGRVNLNASTTEPFTNIVRMNAIQGVFTNLTNVSSGTILDNIFNHTTTTDDILRIPGVYSSVGELVEVAGIADGGESSEDHLRQSADLFSTQGNVFRVFAVGQTIQQTPSGRIVILAEKSVITLLERRETGGLRTVYWKVLPF